MCVLGGTGRYGLDEVGGKMTLDAATLTNSMEHLNAGALGVRICEEAGAVVIERLDPLIGIDEVSELVGFVPATIRSMVRKGLLHPVRSKGRSGSMRFRKSRLIADLRRIEDL
jgi:hypothetical protein